MASNVTTFKQLHLADGAVLFVAENDVSGAWPAGFLQMYAGSAAPTGWLLCDGSSLLRASYTDLFAVIGTTYGAVDGTHFTLPDFRGRSPLGQGTGSGLTARALAATGGEENHTLSTAEIPAHAHPYTVNQGYAAAVSATKGPDLSLGTAQSTFNTSNNTGGGGSHNTMHPFLVVNFIIKT